MRNLSIKKILSKLISAVLVFCISIAGGYLGASYVIKENSGGSSQIIKTSATDKATNDIATIAASTSDTVVEISTSMVQMGSWMQQYVSEGAGSGVILTTDGYIVTNNHVVNGAKGIKVTLKDGSEYDATLVGADANNDIAVIKIDAKNLTVAAIGDSDKLVVGETVVAIGNPLGSLGGTVTSGIISATSRTITIENVDMTLLQTNAAINPGNSGGGLFNTNGELIGVVNAKSSGEDIEGLGFAIPVNTAIDIAQQIIDNGFSEGNYTLGIQMLEASSRMIAKQYGYDEAGIYIYEVIRGGNAEKAGLKTGDRLITINGKEIDSFETAKAIIKSMKKGKTLKIVVDRNDKEITFNIEI